MAKYRLFLYGGPNAETVFEAPNEAEAIAVGNSFYIASSSIFSRVEVWTVPPLRKLGDPEPDRAQLLMEITEPLPLGPPTENIARSFVSVATNLCSKHPYAERCHGIQQQMVEFRALLSAGL